MKRILLKFYADTNLGDDLMVHLLLRRFPGWEFYAFSRRPEHFTQFFSHPNFHALDRGYLKTAVGREKFDAYLLLGGSVLNYNCPTGLLYQLKEMLICAVLRARSVPSLVVGANLAMPQKAARFRMAKLLLALRLRLLDLITVRDSLSFRVMGPLARCKVSCYPDLVFGYPVFIRPVRSEQVNTLGISVLGNLSGSARLRLTEKLAELSDSFLRSGGGKVLLLAFDTGLGGDGEAALEVLGKMKNQKQAEVIRYDGDTGGFFAHLTRCDALLSIRLHSCILGLIMGIPQIPLIYAGKTENLLRDLGYAGAVMALDELFSADPELLAGVLKSGAVRAFCPEEKRLRLLSENSKEHWNRIEKLLDRTSCCRIGNTTA